MNTPQPAHIEDLLSDLIDGNLSEQDREELMKLLAEDPEQLELLATHLQISEVLSQQLPLRREDILLPSLDDHIKSVGPEEEQVFINGLFRRIRRRKIIRNTAIAATITAMLIPITVTAVPIVMNFSSATAASR